MVLPHYHLKLYHSGNLLKDLKRVEDKGAAVDEAKELTRWVQAQLGATTYTVRAEPCTLDHFPERGRAD
jgi:hypothetical protein